MENRKINIKYSLLQGLFWSYFCPIVAFATVFLVSLNVTFLEIGVITSLGNVISAFIQPTVASMADRSKTISLKGITLFILVLNVIPSLILLFGSPNRLTSIILYVIIMVLAWTLHPLINSFGVYYINLGYKLNFGVSRAVGSALFAVTSVILGFLVKNYGVPMIHLVTIILAICSILVITTFSMDEKNDPQIQHNNDLGDYKGSFIRRHSSYIILLVGVFLLFATHNMTNTYFLQILQNIGGDEKNVGIAMAIAAIAEVPLMVFSDYFIRKFGSVKFLSFSMIFWVVKAVAIMYTGNVLLFYGVMLFQAFSYAPFVPGSVHYTNEVMDGKEKYLGQALMTGSITLGGVLGNIAGAKIITSNGIKGLLYLCTIFAIFGAIIGVTGLLKDTKSNDKVI